MSVVGGIKAWIQGWNKIKESELPRWVKDAYLEWTSKLEIRPYNKTKHFVGKTFIYRVRHGIGKQSEAPIIGWYKKLKTD